MECPGSWISSSLGLCAGEPYHVCVCECVWGGGVWVCVKCLGNWIFSPLGLCAGESYYVYVCLCVCVCVSVGVCEMPGELDLLISGSLCR